MTQITPSFDVRHATAADNQLLAELGAETFAASFAADNTPENMQAYLAAAFSPEKQAQELADPATQFLLLEQAGELVGYAQLRLGPAPASIVGQKPAEIVRFYVRPAWIGRGAGAALMQACIDIAAESECEVIWLGVWERNARAIAFYRKWGFAQVGTQVFQLGADNQTDWLMARSLTT